MIWFFLSMIAFVYFFAHSLIMEKIEVSFYWNKGQIPPWAKNKEHTRLYIYVALAGLLVKKGETVATHPKLNVLYKFVIDNKHGRLVLAERESYFSKLRNMLIYAIAHPIQLEAVGKWFEQKGSSGSRKLQVLRFLADFAAFEGEIDSARKEMLSRIAETLLIPAEQLEIIIEHQQETGKQEKKQQHKKGKAIAKAGEHAKCCVILGVPYDARFEEIKKAYRKLVQVYHPDRFEKASAEEYRIAQQKFIEIQHAYETLERAMVGK